MKWQAIANVTGQINEGARNYLVHKLQKDANVELPHLWTDFISETTQHLHDSQSNIEVLPNSKTGGLSCVTKFDELHPDFLENNNKPFSVYALEKYDKRAANLIANVKNPFTRKSLENKIGNYRVDFASNINHTDIKLVEGKRHMMAVESIEKLKNATHSHPEIYQTHLQDCFTAINSLSLLPLEKEQLLHQAKSELVGAASLGMLKRFPDSLISQSKLPPESQPLWMQDLSLEQRVKLDNQLKHREKHRQIMRQHEIGTLIKSNKESILETGESIKGIDNLVISAYGKNSRQFQQFKQDESLYKQAFSVTDQIKHVSFEDGKKLLEAVKPVGGDRDYHYKQQIYNIASNLYEQQLRQASLDPARLVEELYIDEIPENMTFEERIFWRTTKQQQKGILTPRRLTNLEQAEFISKIKSDDINEVKSTIDSISGLRDDNGNNYGLEVMEEVLRDESGRLPLLISSYANAKLYNRSVAGIFLEMVGKNNLFSKSEEREFNEIIEKDKVVKEWTNNLRKQNIRGTTETEEMKGAIKYLAAYYSLNLSLSPDKAVKKAVNEMINERYIEVKGLPIPKEIISNNEIHNLNKDYIDASLVELKAGIINGNISYVRGNEPDSKYAKEMVEEALRLGRWNLTPDKKSVYFSFLTRDGNYLPLKSEQGQLLKFDLVDLNNPKALSKQEQEFKQMAIEVQNKFGYGW